MKIKWFASLAFLILLETSKTESQDARVKLCGREFIRMVVTSCGSSRLKRNVLDSDFQFANPDSRFAFFRHSCYPFIYLLFTLYVFTLFCILIHLLIFLPSALFQGTNKTGWTEISLHTRNGPQLLRTSSGKSTTPLRAWQSIQPPTSTRAHQQSFWNTPPLCRISACPPGPVAMSGQRASAVLLDVPWVNWFSTAKLTPDLRYR